MTTSTIFALSTPPGRSAIAVIRMSGPHTGALLDAMCSSRPQPRTAALRRLKDPATGDILDEALVLYFASPKTETGEDMAEFQVHGGKAIVRAVLDTLSRQPGCRPAEPGEFAQRAFANGKLDLAQIEGLADLIDAETQGQRRQAIAQATGLQSKRFDAWRAELLRTMGLVEAAIDFSDEGDVSDNAVAQAEGAARNLRADLAAHLDDGHRGEILREGFRVVLAGPPNAGKSSLLNALARRDAAIVSEEAGTTRDVIDVRLDLDGHAVIVSDTAGIRETSSSVEQEGIRRTLEATRDADLVLWLNFAHPQDGSNTPPPCGEGLGVGVGRPSQVLQIATKSDLLAPESRIHVKQDAFDFAISAKTGVGLDALVAHIAARARDATGNASDPAITRVRHRRELESAVAHIDTFLATPGNPIELRAEDLRLAASALARLTGRIDAEHVLGEIFSRFCIGK
ncbi:MAG: tRNA uridine-5-carboxymethylaminomethyl(34) synthesis GTPase MnmE [Hyphomicrobiaceae bacterium]